jgi:hypothetical protein
MAGCKRDGYRHLIVAVATSQTVVPGADQTHEIDFLHQFSLLIEVNSLLLHKFSLLASVGNIERKRCVSAFLAASTAPESEILQNSLKNSLFVGNVARDRCDSLCRKLDEQ